MATTWNKTEQHMLDDARKNGWTGGTQRDAARLVRAGILERMSGKGMGCGNTPLWRPTAATALEWALDGAAERTVRCLGGEWPVLDEREDAVLVLRKGARTWVPRSLIR